MAVLWGVLLLSVLAAGVVALTVAESREQATAQSWAHAKDASDAAIIEVVTRLSLPGGDRARILGGGAIELDHEAVRATVHVSFEAGRIDLNAASDERLAHANLIGKIAVSLLLLPVLRLPFHIDFAAIESGTFILIGK